jgi:hypothetical protein
MDTLNLYEALEASYETPKQAKERLKNYDYYLNEGLSTPDIKVAFNPKTKKLLVAGAGTYRNADFVTDAYLAFGKLKDTSRYKEAKEVLRRAKKAYGVNTATIVGHSLFGQVASGIGGKNDEIITYNKGATIGQKVRPNEKAYRSAGDVVSLLASGDKNMRTIPPQIDQPLSGFEEPKQFNLFQPHALANLNEEETKNIYIEPITQPTFMLEPRYRENQFQERQATSEPKFLRGSMEL